MSESFESGPERAAKALAGSAGTGDGSLCHVRSAVEWIREVQLPSGMIPWFQDGHGDPWNHLEAAMALSVGGAFNDAERAFAWLEATQRADGAWHTYYFSDGTVEEPRLDTNVSCYVATGVWHHFLATRDMGFLEHFWPVLERAVGFALFWQRPGGELVWSIDADGTPGRFGLLSGSSSAYFSLRCALACALQLGLERPDWELAARRLRRALSGGSPGFAEKDEFAMDWYYPVLVGAIDGDQAQHRIDQRFDEFVIDGRGVRCVSHRPWVTAAETAECAMALARIGRHDQAALLLGYAARHRCSDGAYLTGIVYPHRATYPREERSSYTAAAVVLATDALFGLSPASQLFVGAPLPGGGEAGFVGPAIRRSTRRLSLPAEGSSVNSPEASARRKIS
jgi:hypothetical protein